MSRIKDDVRRKELGIPDEPWYDNKMFFDNEDTAKQDLAWLEAHNKNMRVYLLVAENAVTIATKTLADDFDDVIPF